MVQITLLYQNSNSKNINRLDSIEAMKEANKIIKREGYYKNLSDKDAKKILPFLFKP